MSSLIQQISKAIATSVVGFTVLALPMKDAEAIIFTNREEWAANFVPNSIITEDFESSPIGYFDPGGGYTTTIDLGLIDVFIGPANYIVVSPIRDLKISDYGNLGDGTTIINFRNPIFGFGFDFSQAFGRFAVSTDSDGITFSSNSGFLGVVEKQPFQTITFTKLESFGYATPEITLDNLSFSSELKDAVPMPEPTSLTALGLFFAGLLWSRFRSA